MCKQPRTGDQAAADHAGAILSTLAALGEDLRFEHLFKGWQCIITIQQGSGEAILEAQRQLLDMAQRHAASLTGQVGCSTHVHALEWHPWC